MCAFSHLHVHTQFSILDGHGSIQKLVQKAKKEGQPALAITDHGFMYGVVQHYVACMEAGIKPILGCELYTAERTCYDRDEKRGHIILLAKNQTGYQNLVKLCSIAATDGFYYKPRVDTQLLRKYHEGLICLSACISGDIPRLLLAGEWEKAVSKAQEYQDIFGPDFYIELQYHGLPDQKTVLPKLIELAHQLDIRLVATNDVHYVEKEDALAQRVLMCIGMKKSIHDETALGYGAPSEWYLKSEHEMRLLFDKIAPGAVDTAGEIAEQCNVKLEFGTYRLPTFPTPANQPDNSTYLRKLSHLGLKRRYGEERARQYAPQLEYELNTIEKMGFVDYILIVQDFIRYAKKNQIPVGPGRGSAAGSLVCYSIGITDVDPMDFQLLFERFLNPERISMPDIDVDFEPEGREEVIQYVAQKYGWTHVAQIITFGTEAAKSAIRDVGKALDMSISETTRLTKLVPATPGITIEEALKSSAALEKLYKEDQKVRKVIDIAKTIEGAPRNTGTHAAGVVLAPDDVFKYVPIQRNTGDGPNLQVVQYCMTDVEKVGMLKVDFLGLRTLSVLRDAEQHVNEHRSKQDPTFSIWTVSYDDPAVYAMLSQGQTKGVFQLESQGMRDVLMRLKPTCIEDLVAVIALYRPGPMDSIPKFIESKQHPERIVYKHPLLEPILAPTYGCILYQEQVMAIVQALAGYSYGHADLVRRAMAKKKAEKMALEKEYFIHGKINPDGSIDCDGCLKRGIPLDVAESLWAEMESFASYAFNKSHAVSYATLAYRTAYMRCYYPLEYQAAQMTNAIDDTKKLLSFISDCESRGLQVLPPDINSSDICFTVENHAIRFGLLAIRSTGRVVLAEILTERNIGGPFKDLQNLMERCPLSCNKGTLEALIKSGAMDGFPQNRAQLLSAMPKMLKHMSSLKKDVMENQISLEDMFFSTGEEGTGPASISLGVVEYPDIPDIPTKEKLEQEFESTGIYISGHPMDAYREITKGRLTHYTLSELTAVAEQSEEDAGEEFIVPNQSVVRVAGVITVLKQRVTRKDKSPMCSMTISDRSGKLEVTVFPRAYAAYGSKLAPGVAVLLIGKLEDSDFGRQLSANTVEFLEETLQSRSK